MDNYEERAIRLREVFSYLFVYKSISTQKEMAIKIKMPPTSLSAAMNGKKLYLTNKTFFKICAAYPEVFDLDYLLTGEGELLIQSPIKRPYPQTVRVDEIEKSKDIYTLFNLAKKLIKANEALRRDLIACIAELRSLIVRYGPIAEQPSQKIIHQLSDMVAGDKGFE